MGRNKDRRRVVTREKLFLAAFLFVYAFLILSSDPEWLMWAGPVMLGALPVAAAPPLPALDPMETVQAASYAALLGLLGVVVLLALRDPARVRRHSDATARHEATPPAVVPGTAEERKAA